MTDPIYLGENELGIPVYEIKEGEMRPLVDKEGKIKCAWCTRTLKPKRYILKLDEVKGIDWAVLFCPKCTMAHCIMKVELVGGGSERAKQGVQTAVDSLKRDRMRGLDV